MKVKSYVLNIWNILDPIYYSLTRLTYVGAKSDNNIFRVRLTRFRGKGGTLADGTRLQKGDLLLKIHLHNVVLLRALSSMNSDLQRGRYIYQAIERSLPGIADYVQSHPESERIRGIVGISILNKGCKPLGFDTFPIASPWFRLLKWATILPIYLLSVTQPLKTFKKQSPKYIVMSKNTLMERYGYPNKLEQGESEGASNCPQPQSPLPLA